MRTGPFERFLDRVESALGYTFADRELLRRALTHRSFAHERGLTNHNESLEFLGDAVLGMLVAERIVQRRPELDEGAMTRLRSSLVSTRNLSREAATLNLGECLLLGRGEERSGGRTKPSLLADAYEAVVAAMYLDGGIRVVRSLVRRVFGKRIDDSSVRTGAHGDPKTTLQELVQAQGWLLPHYRLIDEHGPDHDRTFTVEVVINGSVRGSGSGSSKKRAEQEAAMQALQALEADAG